MTDRFCCAKNCFNTKLSTKELAFFRFPKNEERAKIWLVNSGRKDLSHKTAKQLSDSQYLICGKHFLDNQFVDPTNKVKLCKTAVPTVFSKTPAGSSISSYLRGMDSKRLHIIEEMAFELSETPPLPILKDEYILGNEVDTNPEQYLCGNSIKQESLEENCKIEIKQPSTAPVISFEAGFCIKTEPLELEIDIIDSGNHDEEEKPSNMTFMAQSGDISSQFCSENQNDDKSFVPTNPLTSGRMTKKFPCSLCGKEFHSLETQRKHSKIHIKSQSYQCDICSKTFSMHSYLKRHRTIHNTENEKLTCEYCLKKYSDKIRLRQHQNQVHFNTDRKYKCDICAKTFKLECALKTHLQMHSGKKPYTCDICRAAFSTHANLIGHRKIHMQEKPFKCSFCNRGFMRLIHLKNHYAVHSGTRLHNCTVCGKSFGHSSSLRQHQLLHTGQRFVCNLCNKSYPRPDHLRLHIARAHTKVKKFTCEVCSDMFYTTGELMLHLRAHIGEKPYRCEVCKKSFVTSFRRNEHSRLHTNNKPYQCEKCGKQYYTLKRLKGHVNIHQK